MDATPDDASGHDAVADGFTNDADLPFTCSPPLPGTLLCDDFESSSTVSSKWTMLFALNGGTGALDTSIYVSPTHSALLDVPMISTGVGWANLYYQAMGVTASRLELKAETRVSAIDKSQSVPLMRISYATPTSSGEVDYDIVASGNELAVVAVSPLADGGLNADSQTIMPYALDTWFNVRYEVDTSGMVPVVSVWINGMQLVSRAFVAPGPSPADSYRSINVGIVYESGTTTAATVHYDNVNFRAF